ncbi:MAG: protein kinase [Sandaracinaceae bacterium]|nr:protein kinase [Sandaracinaceae bacterium]
MTELIDGRYRLRLVRGEGGMGRVYDAWDINLHRAVALKLMARATSAKEVERAAREARALASIRHRGVPEVYAFGRDGGRPFFVMELVVGTTLRDIVHKHYVHGAAVPLHRATTIALDLADALGAAHAAGVLHRDIKSENVIIEDDTGRTVLVDFGIATTKENASASAPVGTPETVAPEIWDGAPPSVASDLYALGCLVHELLTGRSPFAGDTLQEVVEAHRSRSPRALVSVDPALAAFDPVLTRALAKDPAERPRTCAAFGAALETAWVDANEQAPEGREVLLTADPDAVQILIVDDDPVFARLTKRAAQRAFADTLVAVSRVDSGEAAVASAAHRMPHLLLLDHHLPGMNGAEALSRIRALPGGESVAVIVMSGAIGAGDWWRFSSLGVVTHVTKPADFGALVEAILQKARPRGWLPPVDRNRPTPEEVETVE